MSNRNSGGSYCAARAAGTRVAAPAKHPPGQSERTIGLAGGEFTEVPGSGIDLLLDRTGYRTRRRLAAPKGFQAEAYHAGDDAISIARLWNKPF